MTTRSDTERLVCDDILARQDRGVAKYGITVAANPLTLREWLQHAYEECLDQAVYLRRAIQEIDSPKAGDESTEQELRTLIEMLYDAMHRGVGPMASADDSELAETINDCMCGLYGNDWHRGMEGDER